MIARRVASATDGNFRIQVFASGHIGSGLQVLDAVQNGTVACGHTVSYYFVTTVRLALPALARFFKQLLSDRVAGMN